MNGTTSAILAYVAALGLMWGYAAWIWFVGRHNDRPATGQRSKS